MADRPRVRLTEDEPARGEPIEAAPGIWRIVATNPGPMTYYGTTTWLGAHGAGDRLALIDPGPDDRNHLDAVLAFGAGRIDRVLVSHAHGDHVGAAPRLAERLGLPIEGHVDLFARAELPTGRVLADGDRVAGLEVVHTPGHAQEHLCFAREADGILFTADHVMGWSTSVVPPPPWGDASDYLASLDKLIAREDRLLLPGHGPAITRPREAMRTLYAQRLRRERDVIAALAAIGPASVDALTARLYPTLKPGLDMAARANVQGFLAKLAGENRARERDALWSAIGPAVEGADRVERPVG